VWRAAARARAGQFSWQETARRALEIYDELKQRKGNRHDL